MLEVHARTTLQNCRLGIVPFPAIEPPPNLLAWTGGGFVLSFEDWIMKQSFHCTVSERWYIGKIIKRAIIEIDWVGEFYDVDSKPLEMMLTSVHSSGCPLDFKKLLDSKEVEFAHDINRMHNSINTKTGAFDGQWLPYCAILAKQNVKQT